MPNKIRAHKLVSSYIKTADLEYTPKEIMFNIQKYGVLIDSAVVTNRLEWVFDSSQVELINWPQREQGSFDKVKIIFDTQDYLVIFKPVNVVVEAGSGHQKNNLIVWLTQNYNLLENTKFKTANPSFFLVNRLDKDTQGILLIAKSLQIQEFFQDQFRNRTVVKKYLALVDNFVDKMWITTHYQSRNKHNPLKQKLFWSEAEAAKFDNNYRIANTEIKPLVFCKQTNQTLIEVNLKTGRMHQIRLLCEELGFPIANEKLYNKKIIPPAKVSEMSHNLDSQILILDQEQLQVITDKIFFDSNYLLSNYLEINEPENDIRKVYQIFDTTSLK